MADFDKWTVKALKEYCKEHKIKIPVGSKKADIVVLLENTSHTLEQELVLDPLTKKRQGIIKKALAICRKKGKQEILDYFDRRNKNPRLKQTFDVFKLNLKDPNTNEIRVCLKYYQEEGDYDADEKLLINQMITQSKYITSDYIDPRLKEFRQFEIESHTYDIPTSKTGKRNESLNKIT